jgi:hypothetical protein
MTSRLISQKLNSFTLTQGGKTVHARMQVEAVAMDLDLSAAQQEDPPKITERASRSYFL